jgi:hypothetical protein
MTQQELEQTVIVLKGRIDALEKTDRYTFAKLVQMLDGRNVQLGKTTGTKIGTAADQKLAFYGATPIIRQGGISTPSGGATVDAASRTAITLVINALRNVGLIS